MPYVVLKYEPGIIPDDVLKRLAEALPDIVSQALSAADPSVPVASRSVSVDPQPVGKYGRLAKPAIAMVFTGSTPARAAGLEDLSAKISAALTGVADCGVEISAWPLLQAGKFTTNGK